MNAGAFDEAVERHHAAIDAQIEVLEKRLSSDEIDARSVFEDEPDYHESDRWKTNERDAANEARQWLDGTYTDSKDLVAEWKELAR